MALCERCNNGQSETITYSSCAQANVDNYQGHSDWISQSYIPAMSWATAGDGTICGSFGQGLVATWLSSSMNDVNYTANTNTGDGDGGDGGNSGGPPPVPPVRDIPAQTLDNWGNQVSLVDPAQNQCYYSNSPGEAVYSTTLTTANVLCRLETIPTPRINHITNLICTTNPNIFNKPEEFVNESGVTVMQTLLTNYIGANGNTHNLKVTGDFNANYRLMVKDITNSKFYDWPNDIFDNGWVEKSEFIGQTNDTWDLVIPTVTTATTYHVWFNHVSPTTYELGLPTQVDPWVINQLADVTTTIHWNGAIDGAAITTDGTNESTVAYTITNPAGSILNASGNSGVQNITITFSVSSGKSLRFNSERINYYGSGIHDTAATIDDLVTPATTHPEILAMNLVASYENDGTYKSGTLTGTITLGEIGLDDETIYFDPNQFFDLL